MKLSPRTTFTFTLGLLTAAVLAGCTTTPTSTPAPSVSASRQATEEDLPPITLPVNTCYKNDAIDSAGDTFTIQIGDKDVPYGKSACFVTDDRNTQIKFYRNTSRDEFYATFKASNQYIGNPWLSIKFVDDLEPNSHTYAVYETYTYEDRYEFIYTVLRKEDTNEMKQFTVDISLRQ